MSNYEVEFFYDGFLLTGFTTKTNPIGEVEAALTKYKISHTTLNISETKYQVNCDTLVFDITYIVAAIRSEIVDLEEDNNDNNDDDEPYDAEEDGDEWPETGPWSRN